MFEFFIFKRILNFTLSTFSKFPFFLFSKIIIPSQFKTINSILTIFQKLLWSLVNKWTEAENSRFSEQGKELRLPGERERWAPNFLSWLHLFPFWILCSQLPKNDKLKILFRNILILVAKANLIQRKKERNYNILMETIFMSRLLEAFESF